METLTNVQKKFRRDPDFEGDASGEESAGEMTWKHPSFTKDMIKLHLKNKKKRIHSSSFSHSGTNGLTVNGVPSDRDSLVNAMQKVSIVGSRVPFSKNSKKSRNGLKVSPKKRGGKNAQKLVDDLDEIELDHNDPDYDSELNDPVVYDELRPILPEDEYEELVNSLLKEYFEHRQTSEIINSLCDLNLSSDQCRRLPYLAITLALEFKLSQCELTSTLLSDLYNVIISPIHMQEGFSLVLDELSEITIDVPKAPEFVGRFIARAIADDILPPRFVQANRIGSNSTSLGKIVPPTLQHNDVNSKRLSVDKVSEFTKVSDLNLQNTNSRCTLRSNSGGDAAIGTDTLQNGNRSETNSSGVSSAMGDGSLSASLSSASDLVQQALSKAESLLTLSHAFARLDHVWGVRLGVGANEHLIEQMKMLLQEYLISNDLFEATRCLQELDSPHFHHELVYQACLLVFEHSDDKTKMKIANLLDSFSRSVIISLDQLVTGVKRIFSELPDIQIDIPTAYVTMERFLNCSIELGYMPKKLASELPTKSRRRFVSEGDTLHRTAATLDDDN